MMKREHEALFSFIQVVNKLRRRIGFILLGTAGVGLLLFLFRDFLFGWLQNKNFAAVTPPGERIESQYEGQVSNLSEAELLSADPQVLSDFGIGVIEIPAIDMKVPVLEGISEEILKLGAGTMKAGQVAGKGNYALAGHNMANGCLFGKLNQVSKGQTIQLEAYQKKADYVITDIFHDVSPSRIELIEDTEGEGLITLVTCNSDGNNRLTIRGELKSGSKKGASLNE